MSDGKAGWLTMKLVRYYLVAYGLFAFLLSGFMGVLALFSPDKMGALAMAAVASYGFGSAILMWRAWARLRRRALDAPKWTKAALVSGLPGSAITGLIGVMLCWAGLDNVGSSRVMWLAVLVGAPVLIASVLNAVALIVVLFQNLDELLWERTSDEMAGDDMLSFMEEEVELDSAAAAEEVNEDAPVVVEVR